MTIKPPVDEMKLMTESPGTLSVTTQLFKGGKKIASFDAPNLEFSPTEVGEAAVKFAKESMSHYYSMDIAYEVWEESHNHVNFDGFYALDTYHKMDNTTWKVTSIDKNIAKQCMTVVFVEDPTVGITGMDEVPPGFKKNPVGNFDPDTGDWVLDKELGELGGEVKIDPIVKFTEEGHFNEVGKWVSDNKKINLKERTERAKLFYELTEGVTS